MGLQLYVKKRRRFVFAYSRWEEEEPAPIIVHLDDWTPHHVEVRLRGHQGYLGVQMDPKNAATLEICKDIASQYNPASHQPQPRLQFYS